MAIDVLLVLHLPVAVEAEVAPEMYRVATLPKAPTVSEEVWIADDVYFQVNRVLYREDTRVELHFMGQTLYGWDVAGAQATHTTLTGLDWSDESPWAPTPEPSPAPE
jgi:hypothetical protein